MNLKSLATVLLLSSTSIFAVACGGANDGDDADQSEADIKAGKVTPGVFKLYPLGEVAHPGCDIHTKLTLEAKSYSTATLEEAVGGLCQIAVMPNLRSYRLKLVATPCGSKVFTGSHTSGGKTTEVKITDHRSRMCMDMQPGQVVVEETQADGTVVTKYGNEYQPLTPAAGSPIEVTGTLVRSFGIGGENTGRSVKTADKTWELVLDAKENASFVEQATARIRGKVTYLSGVETQNRPAIDVSEILACPAKGYVNCMPITTNPLCKADARSWVEASCPGVEFLD